MSVPITLVTKKLETYGILSTFIDGTAHVSKRPGDSNEQQKALFNGYYGIHGCDGRIEEISVENCW